MSQLSFEELTHQLELISEDMMLQRITNTDLDCHVSHGRTIGDLLGVDSINGVMYIIVHFDEILYSGDLMDMEMAINELDE